MKGQAARIGYHPLASIARGLVWAVCVAAAWTLPLYPGIRINLDAAAGQGEAWTYFAIGSIVFGAICLEALRQALSRGKYATALMALVVGAFFLWLNISTGIGNSSTHSEHRREDTSSQNEQKQRAARMRNQSSQARKAQADIAGDATPAAIEGEMQATQAEHARQWQLSEHCNPDRTKGETARDFCKTYHGLESKLAAAKKRDELDIKIEHLEREIKALGGETASSIDPRADQIGLFLSMLGVNMDKLAVASLYDWEKAIGLDALAFFGPAFCMFLIGILFEEKVASDRTPQEKPKAKPLETKKPRHAVHGR
jgi:hypothetical protein